LTKWVLMTITMCFTVVFFLNPHSSAWHENLGIDNNKAAELYQTKPNDPAIVQWKNALQLAINKADDCFNIRSAITCQTLISTITSNCETHPNELLACNDARLAMFPAILKQAFEAQEKEEEEQKKAAKAQEEYQKKDYSIKIQAYATDILNKCFISSLNASSEFEVASPLCEIELSSLQSDCQLANTTYNYCKDERFIGYLKQHNILNSTALP
jgi:hypothetical protein